MTRVDYIRNYPLNGGEMRDVAIENGVTYRVEVMGPGISGHPDQMIAMYFDVGGKKVEVAFNGAKYFIFHFKHLEDAQHYWSTMKEPYDMDKSRRYHFVAQVMPKIYKVVFGGRGA